jgi:carbon monoxide dehydrogenase subunit G
MIEKALPGCQFLVEVDTDDPDFDALRESAEDRELTSDPEVIEGRSFEEGGMYAALMELSVGSVAPTFKVVVTIDEREKPRMLASGEGEASSSSFEMSSGMELTGTDDGNVAVEWWAEADVFGRIAQMGQRVINPVANRVVKRFFNDIQSQLQDLAIAEDEEAATAGSGAAGAGDAPSSGGTKQKQKSSGGILARIKRLLGLGG